MDWTTLVFVLPVAVSLVLAAVASRCRCAPATHPLCAPPPQFPPISLLPYLSQIRGGDNSISPRIG